MKHLRSLLACAALISAIVPTMVIAKDDFTPQVGQSGKDVIWVPTPDVLVERMLRMAQVTPSDVVVDLGSGDGRIVIAAAKLFNTKARGIEYNADMVALSRRNAEKAGVSELARFEQGDIFKTDFSNATVVTMYLLPSLNLKLRPILMRMKPGTRLVSHQFTMGDWEADEISTVENRPGYLWIVPANAGGNWTLSIGNANTEVSIDQTYQKIVGSARFPKVQATFREARVRGDQIMFGLMDEQGVLRQFVGTIRGDRIEGTATGPNGATPFTMTRQGIAPAIRGSQA
ncbi:MAG TPA: methyltransferase domain-containing protein [Burkholderiaceae bacterium]|nr:methyltransferase domain-containing protein [Burkholderiaceae bacterium]